MYFRNIHLSVSEKLVANCSKTNRHYEKLKKTQIAIFIQVPFLFHVGDGENLNFMQIAKVQVYVSIIP